MSSIVTAHSVLCTLQPIELIFLSLADEVALLRAAMSKQQAISEEAKRQLQAQLQAQEQLALQLQAQAEVLSHQLEMAKVRSGCHWSCLYVQALDPVTFLKVVCFKVVHCVFINHIAASASVSQFH